MSLLKNPVFLIILGIVILATLTTFIILRPSLKDRGNDTNIDSNDAILGQRPDSIHCPLSGDDCLASEIENYEEDPAYSILYFHQAVDRSELYAVFDGVPEHIASESGRHFKIRNDEYGLEAEYILKENDTIFFEGDRVLRGERIGFIDNPGEEGDVNLNALIFNLYDLRTGDKLRFELGGNNTLNIKNINE